MLKSPQMITQLFRAVICEKIYSSFPRKEPRHEPGARYTTPAIMSEILMKRSSYSPRNVQVYSLYFLNVSPVFINNATPAPLVVVGLGNDIS